jgi:hypothetical protein
MPRGVGSRMLIVSAFEGFTIILKRGLMLKDKLGNVKFLVI